MKQPWQRFRFTALVLALALAAGCVGMASQAMIAQQLKEAGKFHNYYTKQKYDTLEESLKATRDYSNQDLAKVTPLKDPLQCKTLFIIPSGPAIQDYYDKVAKATKEWGEMEMRVRMPDYEQIKEKYKGIIQFYPMGQTDENMKRMYDHSVQTDEIRYDFLVEALKKRHIFQEVAVQKAREMGNSHAAAASGSGVVIYLVTLMRPNKMNLQNLWYLKTAGSEEPWLIGTDESVNGWLANVEKTAREQLKFEKP